MEGLLGERGFYLLVLVVVCLFLIGFLFQVLFNDKVARQGSAGQGSVLERADVFARRLRAIFVEVDNYPRDAGSRAFNDRGSILNDDETIRVPVKEFRKVATGGGCVADLHRRLNVQGYNDR